MVTLVVFVSALVMILVEQIRPARLWPRVPGWIRRVVLLNGIQAAIVVVSGALWDGAFREVSFGFARSLPFAAQVGLGYLLITFVYYWWHRWRHEVPFLWRWFHQVHHSPQRLEVVTSFYKHPFEIVANALLSSALMFGVLGVGEGAAALTVMITGLAELFYHWNIETPRWLGWFFQRPEMHCVHHERGSHRFNYSDLPVWDLLFGTYRNPEVFDGACGFEEGRLSDLLQGRLVPKEGTES